MQDRWVRLQEEEFSVQEEVERVLKVSRRIGGVVCFIGAVRDFSEGRKVTKLEFEHYSGMAEEELERIRQEAKQKFGATEISVVHRYGSLEPGDTIVLVVAGAEHREQAFGACRYVIDELKKRVPIWKKEHTPEGEVWVQEHP